MGVEGEEGPMAPAQLSRCGEAGSRMMGCLRWVWLSHGSLLRKGLNGWVTL